MKNGAMTARTEMRNCLFALVGGGKKCDGTIVSISWPNNISKAVLMQIAQKPPERQAPLKTAEWLCMHVCVCVYI